MRLEAWELHIEVAKHGGQYVVRCTRSQCGNPSSRTDDDAVLKNKEELAQWLARQSLYTL